MEKGLLNSSVFRKGEEFIGPYARYTDRSGGGIRFFQENLTVPRLFTTKNDRAKTFNGKNVYKSYELIELENC